MGTRNGVLCPGASVSGMHHWRRMYSVSYSRHSVLPSSNTGEGPSQVKLQPGSSLVLPREGAAVQQLGSEVSSGLLQPQSLSFSSSCIPTPHQLMLMSVLTCLFESLDPRAKVSEVLWPPRLPSPRPWYITGRMVPCFSLSLHKMKSGARATCKAPALYLIKQ